MATTRLRIGKIKEKKVFVVFLEKKCCRYICVGASHRF